LVGRLLWNHLRHGSRSAAGRKEDDSMSKDAKVSKQVGENLVKLFGPELSVQLSEEGLVGQKSDDTNQASARLYGMHLLQHNRDTCRNLATITSPVQLSLVVEEWTIIEVLGADYPTTICQVDFGVGVANTAIKYRKLLESKNLIVRPGGPKSKKGWTLTSEGLALFRSKHPA
jgi:hypothetical protein